MSPALKIRLGCAVAVCLFIGVTVAQASAAGSPQPQVPPPPPQSSQKVGPPIPHGSSGRLPEGVPAIHPRAAVGGNGATFTAADVIQWVNANPRLEHAAGNTPMQVVSVEFITAAKASQRLHGEPIGRPDAAIVCYVHVHGDFQAYAPPGYESASHAYHDGYLLFDAQTGNLLMSNV